MSPFSTTSWTLVRTAGLGSESARDALDQLCRKYWRPLYVFARRSNRSHQDAQDLVQGFFAGFIEGNYLDLATPDKGRFRNYLLGALKHHMANVKAGAGAKKRGGEQIHVPLEQYFQDDEFRFDVIASPGETPDSAYEKQWALTLLGRVLDRLEAEHETLGKSEQYCALKDCLPGGRGQRPAAELAGELGTTPEAVRAVLRRLRLRCGQLLREEIQETLSDPGEVDREMRHLLRILAR